MCHKSHYKKPYHSSVKEIFPLLSSFVRFKPEKTRFYPVSSTVPEEIGFVRKKPNLDNYQRVYDFQVQEQTSHDI